MDNVEIIVLVPAVIILFVVVFLLVGKVRTLEAQMEAAEERLVVLAQAGKDSMDLLKDLMEKMKEVANDSLRNRR